MNERDREIVGAQLGRDVVALLVFRGERVHAPIRDILDRFDDTGLEGPALRQLEQTKPLAPLDDDVQATILELFEDAADPGACPDLVDGAVAGREREAELLPRLHALADQLAVARLEDVQRDPLRGDEHDR